MKAPRTILVVEDQEIDRKVAARILRKVWPATAVLEARDGEEAIKTLEHCGSAMPDLILLDINMPKMSGHEFLESWFTGRGNEIPVVIMLTSSNSPTDRERASRFPCVRGYIVKPITRALAEQLTELAARPD